MPKSCIQKFKDMFNYNNLISKLSEKVEDLKINFDDAIYEIGKGKKSANNNLEKIRNDLDDICKILKKMDDNTNYEIECKKSKVKFELRNEYLTAYKDVEAYNLETWEARENKVRENSKNTKALKVLSNKNNNERKVPVFLKLIEELKTELYNYYDPIPKDDEYSKYSKSIMGTDKKCVIKSYMDSLLEYLNIYIDVAQKSTRYHINEIISLFKPLVNFIKKFIPKSKNN